MTEQNGNVIDIEEKLLKPTLDEIVRLLELSPKHELDEILLAQGMINKNDETAYMPVEEPTYIINKGTNQIVYNLGTGLVVKINNDSTTPSAVNGFKPIPLQWSGNTHGTYDSRLGIGFRFLSEIGMPSAEHRFFNARFSDGHYVISGDGMNFCVCPDLRSIAPGGIYDALGFDFGQLTNGGELEREMRKYEEILSKLPTCSTATTRRVNEYSIQPYKHEKEGPLTAFFVLVNENNRGRLVADDLNFIVMPSISSTQKHHVEAWNIF